MVNKEIKVLLLFWNSYYFYVFFSVMTEPFQTFFFLVQPVRPYSHRRRYTYLQASLTSVFVL